ncbi:MAG: hypothetical protein AAGA12_02470 [Pseudomonadota bacterium]
MSENEKDPGEIQVDALLDQLAMVSHDPLPDALTARILADAAAVQPSRPVTPERETPTLFAGILATLGGWPAMGGLATAALTGIYVGFADPTLINDPLGTAQAEFSDDWDNAQTMFDEGVLQ